MVVMKMLKVYRLYKTSSVEALEKFDFMGSYFNLKLT
jgi:hypothetical protein